LIITSGLAIRWRRFAELTMRLAHELGFWSYPGVTMAAPE